MKKTTILLAYSLVASACLFADTNDDNKRVDIYTKKRVEIMGDSKDCDTYIDKEDAKALYAGHGFTRGDVARLKETKYDPSMKVDIQGTIAKVVRVKYFGECHLLAIVTTPSGETLVNIAPVSFLDENGLTINEGDKIQIAGSQQRINGRNSLIAATITKDGRTVDLRDAQGQKKWKSENGVDRDRLDSKNPTKPSQNY
jgi:hypothetical protein